MVSLKKIFNMLLLNLLWLVCSLPLVTMGASTCAAFYVCLKMVDDEEVQVVRMFFKAFKEDFMQGTLMLCVTSPCIILGYLMWHYLITEADKNILLFAGALVVTLILILINFFSYPLIARYSNTLKNTIRNSVGLAAQNFKKTLWSIFLVGVEITLLCLQPLLTFIGLFIIPVLAIYTISITAKPIFYRIEHPEPVEEEETEEDDDEEAEADDETETEGTDPLETDEASLEDEE